MNVPYAIAIKLVSVLLLVVMSTLIRAAGAKFPLGEIVFFRSAFALVPVIAIYAAHGRLLAALATSRPLGHLGRGALGIASMFLNFAALARLPLMDATAISFAAPLITVVLAALLLNEHVRAYRWSAVSLGFVGVIVMLWPYLDIWSLFYVGSPARTVGAICAMVACFTNAGTVIQTRRLTDSETNSAIVFYFSLICGLAGLATLPFGWVMPSPLEFVELALIGILGGLSHLMLTESYRYAPASVVAPFDYTAMVWAFLLGYVVFGELPSVFVFVGAAIVIACGLFVIWREHKAGVERLRPDAEGAPAGE
jgi:drug/metabolite transporter (DMT)-like permease